MLNTGIERHSLFVNGEYSITDNIKFSTDLLYNKRSTTAAGGRLSVPARVLFAVDAAGQPGRLLHRPVAGELLQPDRRAGVLLPPRLGSAAHHAERPADLPLLRHAGRQLRHRRPHLELGRRRLCQQQRRGDDQPRRLQPDRAHRRPGSVVPRSDHRPGHLRHGAGQRAPATAARPVRAFPGTRS